MELPLERLIELLYSVKFTVLSTGRKEPENKIQARSWSHYEVINLDKQFFIRSTAIKRILRLA